MLQLSTSSSSTLDSQLAQFSLSSRYELVSLVWIQFPSTQFFTSLFMLLFTLLVHFFGCWNSNHPIQCVDVCWYERDWRPHYQAIHLGKKIVNRKRKRWRRTIAQKTLMIWVRERGGGFGNEEDVGNGFSIHHNQHLHQPVISIVIVEW